MAQVQNGETLLVKNIPKALSSQAVEALFKHYGASKIRSMHNSHGKMSGCVFADFDSPDKAQLAAKRLNKLILADHHIKAESTTPLEHRGNEEDLNKQNLNMQQENTLEQKPQPHRLPMYTNPSSGAPKPAPIAPNLGLTYPFPPQLEYRYPKANYEVVANIANALLAVPHFYTQVLHLMNKMNLPPPFDPDFISGAFSKNPIESTTAKKIKRKSDQLLCSDESEFDSDSPEDGVVGTSKPSIAKKTSSSLTPLTHGNTKKVKMSIPEPCIRQSGRQALSSNVKLKSSLPESKAASLFEKSNSDKDSSFLFPRPGVISDAELDKGVVSKDELLDSKVMRQYEVGERSSVLYVKNIARTVEKSDLEYIYGAFFESDEEFKKLVSINLFTEGRMRGQAFIQFTSEEKAELCLTHTHGFLLEGKPLIVCFKRKKKDAESK